MAPISEAKSAAERRDMNSNEFDEEFVLEEHAMSDRSMRLKLLLEKIFNENAELLEKLSDDI